MFGSTYFHRAYTTLKEEGKEGTPEYNLARGLYDLAKQLNALKSDVDSIKRK